MNTWFFLVIFVGLMFWGVHKLFGRPSASRTVASAIVVRKPRIHVQATDETGVIVSEQDPRVLEVTEHPAFVAITPMMACGDWGAARRFLQKIAYGVHDATPDDQRIFKKIMTLFAEADPFYQHCIKAILPFVAANPGIKQTALYPHMASAPDVEHVRYVLYFADELGHIVRRKKGNSYEVFLPGQPMPIVQPKAKRGGK